jgi:WD40 repeat protein
MPGLNSTVHFGENGKYCLLLMIKFIPMPCNRSISAALFLLAFPFILDAQEFIYKEKKELKGYPEYVMQAGFSPYRKYFAITIGNNTIEIYDRNWKKVFSYQGNPKSVGGVFAFSPDERYLAYGKYKSNSDIAIIDLADLKVKQVLLGHSDHISDLAFSHNGKFLASCSNDELVKVWKLENEAFTLFETFTDNDQPVNGVSFSFDDKYLACAGNTRNIHLYELKNGQYEPYAVLEAGNYYLNDVVFHPRSYELAAGSGSYIKTWNYGKKGFQPVDSIVEDAEVNDRLSYSPTGEYIAFGNYAKVSILHSADGKLSSAETIYRHYDHVFGATFSDDGLYLTTFGSDKNAIIWEIQGVKPSDASLVASFMNNNLTLAQKSILTPASVAEVIAKLDPALMADRDEFETSAAYDARRAKLADEVLFMLQGLLEKAYKITPGNEPGEVKIPIQQLVGYNADVQVYKARFLEIEAGIDIPVDEAKSLKQNWQKASILASKKQLGGKKSYTYSNFRLLHPVSGKSYPVSPTENPFSGIGDETSDRGRSAEGTTTIKTSTGLVQPGGTGTARGDSPESNSGILSHALLFATNVYDSYPELVNPVNDATTISDELQNSYGVQTEIVMNPTLNETINKIREYAEMSFNAGDNLMIFFAGHGMYDEVFKEGYIISRDSKADDVAKTSYLSHSNLRTMINNIPCKHVFLVMDVCFGGTFDPHVSSHRGADLYSDVSKEEFIERKIQYKTRLYLTSGGKEYVPDGRPGQHSPFARKFIEALRNYGGQDGVLTTNEIFQFVEKVDPQPRFGEFGDNEPGSDFLLVAK